MKQCRDKVIPLKWGARSEISCPKVPLYFWIFHENSQSDPPPLLISPNPKVPIPPGDVYMYIYIYVYMYICIYFI